MKFETHNQTSVDTRGTQLQGECEVSFQILSDCFGDYMPGDGHKTDAEWQIKFEDGTVATIYNWKNGRNYLGNDGPDVQAITDWNIGGASPRSVELVKIAIDLSLESKPKSVIDAALETAMDIRQNLLSIRGPEYLRVVEIGVLIKKQMKIMSFLSGGLVMSAEGYGEKQHELMGNVSSMLLAKILTHSMHLAFGNDDDQAAAKEVQDWIDRLTEAEEMASGTIEKELMRNAGND